jgi:LPS export ABC transporter permease LptG
MRNHQPLSLLLDYLRYFAPGALQVVLPISCLVGAVVAFTLLTRSGELVAIKAAGVGLPRATAPVLLLTLLICGLQFLVQDSIAPASNRKAHEIKDRILGRAPRTYGRPIEGAWSFGSEGRRLYNYRHYDPARETFHGLHVFTLDRDSSWILDHRASQLARWTGEAWDLDGGWYREFPRTGAPGTFEDNRDRTRRVELASPQSFGGGRRSNAAIAGELPHQSTIQELRREIRSLRSSGYDITKLHVAYHAKFARALSPLVMVLLGLPFAFKIGRRGSLYGVGVALVLVLVYWATFAIFNALGEEALLRPSVAAWAPNGLYGLLGAYLLLYVRT